MLDMQLPPQDGIKDAWEELKRSRPRLHQKDAADLLGITEAVLVASRCGDGVVRMKPEWKELLAGLAAVGAVKTITRNQHAVHETIGHYSNLTLQGPFALVQDNGLDLRLLLPAWHCGFAVSERVSTGTRWSLQFYDRRGASVHKIFLEAEADVGAFLRLISRLADADQGTEQLLVEAAAVADHGATTAAVAPDGATLLDDWAALQDTHDFHGMLTAHRIGRREAMTRAQGRFTRSAGTDALRTLLEKVQGSGVPIMVFVGNPGAVQIYTGPVADVRVLGPWLNILDPAFNLHVREDAIESVWIVEKPTADGVVTSLEAYAHDGTEIVTLYGARKPGIPELPAWRAALDALATTVAAVPA